MQQLHIPILNEKHLHFWNCRNLSIYLLWLVSKPCQFFSSIFSFPEAIFVLKFALFHDWKGALQEVLKIFEVPYCRMCLLSCEVSRQEKYNEEKQKC